MSEKSFDKEKLMSEVKFISIPDQPHFVQGVNRTAYKVGDRHNEFIHFNSLAHFIDVIDEGYDKKDWLKRKIAAEIGGRNGKQDKAWTFGSHCKNLETTRKALQFAIPPAVIFERVLKLKESLANLESIQMLERKAKSIKRGRKYSEDGDELCIDRILCGDPLHWSKMTRGKSNNVVRLVYNMSMSCGNSEENMYRLAAFLCIATDLLSIAGFAVQVEACSIAQDATRNSNGGYQGSMFPLKRAEDPVDLQKLACIGIPGLFRSYDFASTCHLMSNEATSGLGRCVTIDNHVKAVFDIDHFIDVSWASDDGQCIQDLDKILKDVASEYMDFSVR